MFSFDIVTDIDSYYGSEHALDVLLKSKASDPNIRDAAGNHALYFAIIGEFFSDLRTHFLAAKLGCANKLLEVNSSLYSTENGVGITR